MTLMSMTFHESYGEIPTRLLSLYRRHNVSTVDHDRILMAFGKSYGDSDIPWQEVLEFVLAHTDMGVFRFPIYL